MNSYRSRLWQLITSASPTGQMPFGPRIAFCVLGITLLGLSWPASARAGVYAAVLAGLGVFVILQAFIGQPVQSLRFGEAELVLRTGERRASTELAGDGETVTAAITSSDRRAPTPSKEDPMVAGSLNYSVGTLAFGAIVDDATAAGSPLHGCEIRLYVFDPYSNALDQVLGPEPAETWLLGQGVTGRAYEAGEYVVATGDAVWNADFGIVESDRDLYRHLHAVAATPVYNRAAHKIAVVTAAAASADTDLAGEDGRARLLRVALQFSRVLVDLLHWFDDQ